MLEGFVQIPILSGSSFLSITNHGLNFNKNVVKRMQQVEYVTMLINSDKKQIAIQKCDKGTADSIPFYHDEKNLKFGVRLNNREVQQMIISMMNWNVNYYNYRADGFMIDDDTMVFDLSCARKSAKKVRDTDKG